MRKEANMQDQLILIVEDDDELATLTGLMLKRAGFTAHRVASGQEAIDFIEQTRSDVVLLDLHLPEVNGWKVLERIHEIYGEGTIPVIVTTAYSDGANRLIGKLQEVRHYLIKPFEATALAEVVGEALTKPEPESS
jgi:CheY-like chemotaxis protein